MIFGTPPPYLCCAVCVSSSYALLLLVTLAHRNELLKLITSHPEQIKSLEVDAIIRSGIRRFAHEVHALASSSSLFFLTINCSFSNQLSSALILDRQSVGGFGRLLHSFGPLRKGAASICVSLLLCSLVLMVVVAAVMVWAGT